MSETPKNTPSRREFLNTSGRIAAVSAFGFGAVPAVHAAENNTIKVALVGCGGRGTGAAVNALSTKSGPTELVAMADVFDHRLQSSLKNLSQKFGKQINVPKDRQFIGFDAYKKAIDCLDGSGVVILATPPGFRPLHLEYAVSKGCNVFMEKAFAVDGPGIRRVLKAGEEAEKKNLKIAGGLMSRHSAALEEAVRQDPRRHHRRRHYLLVLPRAWPRGYRAQTGRHERNGPPDSPFPQLQLAGRQFHPGLADSQPRRVLLGQGRLAGVRPGAGRAVSAHRSRIRCSTTMPSNTRSPTGRGCSPRPGTWPTAGASGAT